VRQGELFGYGRYGDVNAERIGYILLRNLGGEEERIDFRFFRSVHRELFFDRLDVSIWRMEVTVPRALPHPVEMFGFRMFDADESQDRQVQIWGDWNFHEEWTSVTLPGSLLTSWERPGLASLAYVWAVMPLADGAFNLMDDSELVQRAYLL